MIKMHNNKNRRIYQILGMCLLCIAFIYLTYEVTTAWLVDDSTTSNGDPNISIIGTLELDVQTNFNFYNLTLQPDYTYIVDKDNSPIGTYIKTKDLEHDIDGAFVRIKYTTRRMVEGSTEWVDNLDLLTLYFNGNETKNTSQLTEDGKVPEDDKGKWVYNSVDGYYYYLGSVFDELIEFNQGYTTSYKIGNEFKNAQVEIDLQVESIQRQYGAYHKVWKDAPEIFNAFAYDEMKEGERVYGS